MRLAPLVLILALRPLEAFAQDAAASGRARGASDGRVAGREVGADKARAQVLLDAFVRGFRHGLLDPVDQRAVEDAWADGREAGYRPGFDAGHHAGLGRGAQAAADAYARLQGRPAFRREAPPSPPQPPAPSHPSCQPPSEIEAEVAWGRRVRLDPSDLESRGSPLQYERPDPDPPGSRHASGLARAAGFSTEAEISLWSRAYRDEWERAFIDAWQAEADSVSSWTRESQADEGRLAGRHEARRRAACDAFLRGLGEGFRSGHDEGFDDGYEEAWQRTSSFHEQGPVVRADAALVDGGLDGVFEPGEELVLEVLVTNAGLVGAGPEAVRWRGVTGLAGLPLDGALSEPLPAQQRRSERLRLGAIDPHAVFGSGVVVELQPVGGDPAQVRATVGRPIVIERVDAAIEVREGEAVAGAWALLRSVSTRDTQRRTLLEADGVVVEVGPMAAGEQRRVELIIPVDAGAALRDAVTGVVRLSEEGGAFWMQREWTAATSMDRAVAIAAALDDPMRVVPSLVDRLQGEYRAALQEPKLYERARSESQLARFGRALAVTPEPARSLLTREIAAPMLAQAEQRGVPRKVRRAVRDAFGER